MRRKNNNQWDWTLDVFDIQSKIIDVFGEFYKNYPDLYEQIGEAVQELRKKHYKRNKAKIKKLT